MPALLIYLLKVNAALLLFCLGYYGVLRKLTFYTLNRVYLITAILFSSLYPAINIDSLLQRHEKLSAPLQPIQIVVIDFSDRVTQIAQPAAQTNYWQWLVMLFWAGVVVMAFRLMAQFWSLFRIYKQSKPARLYNQPVRVINEEANPFSFWQSIYINPRHHAKGELRSIIAHEQIHVKQWHTLDILLAEISLVFYWFNPGVWLMKKAVAENLEFITDRKILQQGIDAKSYQYSLLYASFNTSPNAMVNHFNISTIKKRIMMMNSKKSSRFGLARYGFIAPAVLVLLLVFGTSKAAFLKKAIAKVKTTTQQAITSLASSDLTDSAASINTATEETAKREIKNLTMQQTGISQNTPVNPDTPKIKLSTKMRLIGSDSALYVLDGVVLKGTDALKDINTNDIESIDVIKDSTAVKLFGDAGKQGVIIFFTKSTVNSTAKSQLRKKLAEIRASDSHHIAGIAIKNNVPLNAITVRGRLDTNAKPTGYYTPAGSTQKIPLYGSEKDILATVGSARKNSSAVNELIKKRDSIDRSIQNLIRKETETNRADNLKEVVVTGYGTKTERPIILKGKPGQPEPLWIVDGKEMPFSPVNELDANSIESISILKDASAAALYGAKAVNGVVIITTKKAVKNPPKKN